MPATCNNCGRPMPDDSGGDPAIRQPCPDCGSRGRNYTLHARGSIDFSSSIDLKPGSVFFGRENELRQLNYFIGGRHASVRISGSAGSGKTFLFSHFLDLNSRFSVAWFDAVLPDFERSYRQFTASLRTREPDTKTLLVVLDNTDYLDDGELQIFLEELRNWKIIDNVVITERRESRRDLRGVEEIPLLPWHQALSKAFEYDLNRVSDLHDASKVDLIIAPQIITLNDKIIHRLKKEPDGVYQLDSRKFEELIAELLSDQGCTVELTQQTRDGGKDIIATLETEIGKVITVVEAKRYQMKNAVGVKLVRELFGVLHLHKATHGMLVTTSRFTKDARSIEEQSDYKLKLKDFEDVKKWIDSYKT